MTAETTHPAPLPPTRPEVELARVFRRAVLALVANGHHKGDFYDTAQARARRLPPGKCRVCAYGALNLGAGSHPDLINGMSALAALALADYLGIPATPAAIGAWNDAAKRSQDDVVTVFRTIADEREAAAR